MEALAEALGMVGMALLRTYVPSAHLPVCLHPAYLPRPASTKAASDTLFFLGALSLFKTVSCSMWWLVICVQLESVWGWD